MAVNPDIEPHQITNDPVVNEVVDLIINRHLQIFNISWIL